MASLAEEPTATLEERLAGAWLGLLEQADRIADRITEAHMVSDAELYVDAAPGVVDDVRATVHDHVRLGILAMAGDAEAMTAGLELWRETGRKRAQQEIGMERVLSAYTLGTRYLWSALDRKRTDGELDGEAVLVGGQHLWGALDFMSGEFIQAYRREAARLERRDLHRQLSTLDALVEGRGADPDFAAEAREVLGIAAEQRVACIVAPFDGSLDEPLSPPVERLQRHGISSHWHVRGGLSFGLLAGSLSDDTTVAALLHPHATGRVGVALSVDGVAGFAAAFQLATRAADTVPRHERRVVAVSQRLPELLVAGTPEVTSLLLQETVGPILAQPPHVAEVLMGTLSALLDSNGSAKHAAVALFCHRNTVIYRVRQIEELTGRSLTDPRDKLMLSLGVLAAERLAQA